MDNNPTKRSLTPIIIVIAIIAGFLVAGAYLWLQLKKSPVGGPSYVTGAGTKIVQDCDKIQDETEKNGCYFGTAEDKDNPSFCEKILNQGMKDYCYLRFAAAKGDSSFCEKMSTKERKDTCFSGLKSVK